MIFISVIKKYNMTSSQQFQSTVGWRTYLDPNTSKRVERFLNKNGSDIFNQIVENMQIAIDDNYSQFTLIVHPNVSSIIVVTTHEYIELLDYCLDWFTKKEDYAQCDVIMKLKTKLLSKNNVFSLN